MSVFTGAHYLALLKPLFKSCAAERTADLCGMLAPEPGTERQVVRIRQTRPSVQKEEVGCSPELAILFLNPSDLP